MDKKALVFLVLCAGCVPQQNTYYDPPPTPEQQAGFDRYQCHLYGVKDDSEKMPDCLMEMSRRRLEGNLRAQEAQKDLIMMQMQNRRSYQPAPVQLPPIDTHPIGRQTSCHQDMVGNINCTTY